MSYSKTIPFIFLLILIFFGFKCDKENQFDLTGKVRDAESNEPLNGIQIQLSFENGYQLKTETVDSGQYQLNLNLDSITENGQLKVIGIESPASNGHRYFNAFSDFQVNPHNLSNGTFIHDFALQCADCSDEIWMPKVFFGMWRILVTDDLNVKDSLDYLVQVLKQNPSIQIELACHTDTRGSITANATLSQKAAEMFCNYLIESGLDSKRMVPKGYGESKPLISDEEITQMKTEEERENAHQTNRRTVFRVISFDYRFE